MNPTDKLEAELKKLIVESLLLPDITPEQIDSTAPLFGEGLSLDSIDALELVIAIDRRYQVKIKSGDPQNQQTFSSVRALAAFIASHRPEAS